MKRVVLLGSPQTKRTLYLTEHAACQTGLHVHFWDWACWDQILQKLRGHSMEAETFLKLDPPLWTSNCLEELNGLAEDYREKLSILGELAETLNIQFLNHPETILALLNKRGCKDTLLRAHLSVTDVLEENVKDAEQLLAAMERHHMYQVFIKPINGSGAAGVSAFRLRPNVRRGRASLNWDSTDSDPAGSSQMVLYTCAAEEFPGGPLVNTKRLRQFTERSEIMSLLNRILALDCVVERWHAKAEHQGCSYDLRCVVQDGSVDFLLARLSKGPITNLHLNNHPLPVQELRLSAHVLDSVAELCLRAAACYPGLRSAGIDVLLEKGSLKPRIIEMNGQGDLIYQDIYHDNLIYRHQARMMKEWLEQPR